MGWRNADCFSDGHFSYCFSTANEEFTWAKTGAVLWWGLRISLQAPHFSCPSQRRPPWDSADCPFLQPGLSGRMVEGLLPSHEAGFTCGRGFLRSKEFLLRFRKTLCCCSWATSTWQKLERLLKAIHPVMVLRLPQLVQDVELSYVILMVIGSELLYDFGFSFPTLSLLTSSVRLHLSWPWLCLFDSKMNTAILSCLLAMSV